MGLFADAVIGQQSTIMRLHRIDQPIKLDGVLDEPVWAEIEPLPLVMSSPTYGAPPTERTEIRLAYDENYLYAAGAFYDSDPGGVRANTLTRDGINFSDDRFAIILDTFNDNENALGFVINPAGARSDFAVYNDGESNRGPPLNRSWDTFWDAAVVRTEEGWFAEVRIPFSSLRFQDDEGRVIMGVITWRAIARKNEVVTFPAIPSKWRWGLYKPSIAQDVLLEGVYSRKPLYVTPYLLGGVQQTPFVGSNGLTGQLTTDPTREIGLDVKYSITSNLTLDVTLNTDFAQVESDDEQINLTRFSLFFPEKRLFFQERASIFEFQTGQQSRVFYSRRIGLTRDGQPLRIYGGVRLIGRIGNWDVGLLDMQTAPYESTPSENFGVLRLRRRVINENSYVGTIFTSRLGTDGRFNYVYGVDGIIRVVNDDYLTITWAQSFENGRSRWDPGSGRLRLAWDKRSDRGLFYRARLGWSGADYNPGIGFVRRKDFTRLVGALGYGWYPGRESLLYKMSLTLRAAAFVRNSDRSIETADAGPELRLNPKIGGFLRIYASTNYESILDTFRIASDAWVPPGNYQFYKVSMFFISPFGYLIRARVNMDAGEFYDGWRVTFGLSPSWSISSHLEVGGEYQINRVRFPGRNQKFDADIFRLRLRGNLDTRFSMSSFIQYNSATQKIGINVRFRYNPRDGNDLYLVYNENLDVNGSDAMLVENRTVLLKLTYTFQQPFRMPLL
ncbi:MAG: carbohydrate binding family 9 domain-containing protein [Calditrichaeota bacterium]|nr:carbohydrate binding family 9 domain-containing protein [Calditrichota bacterium]